MRRIRLGCYSDYASATGLFCPPKAMTTREAAFIFMRYVEAHPKDMSKEAALMVAVALIDRMRANRMAERKPGNIMRIPMHRPCRRPPVGLQSVMPGRLPPDSETAAWEFVCARPTKRI